MKGVAFLTTTFFTLGPLLGVADDVATNSAKPIPATRPEMKVALEKLKDRQPRIPLPEGDAGRSGYLPESWGGGGGMGGFRQFNNFGSGPRGSRNPQYQLNFFLTDECFWVVSRGNNCHYCLGHQELKLRANGLNDDAIAALDSDWSRFDPRKQLALAFARKLTLEPQKVGDPDIAKLKDLFSDPEIIELTFTIAVFNSMNRWTDGMGFPQERHVTSNGEVSFTTPTSEEFQETKSVATPATDLASPSPPTWEQVQQLMSSVRLRVPRVELPAAEHARRELKGVVGNRQPYRWEQALTALPLIGTTHIETWNTVLSDDHLPPRLKAELAFITAVHNHAWYAAAHAAHRLEGLGIAAAANRTLFEVGASGENVAHRLAAKVTAKPHLINDADIAELRQHFSDAESAQILQVICLANLFDRFTEALGLPLEAEVGVESFPIR